MAHRTGDNEDGVITAYPNYAPNAQEQNLPGLDRAMDPLAEHIKLEHWDNDGKPYLEEYRGNDKLKGRAALITGGDSGIGRSVALAFAREGAQVTIVYLPEEEKDAQDVAKLVSQAPMGTKEILCIPADLMDAKQCEEIVQKHMQKWGHLEILVNNASKQVPCKDLKEIDLETTESVFRSNVLGMFALTKFALPHIKRGASIINTSSVTAYKGSAAMTDYSSTKGAIVTFTRSMAVQLAPKGIRVNSVAPGPIYTPLQPASRPADNMEGWTVSGVPLHGRPGQPAEMAPSYVLLACADSNLMTGQVLHLNMGSWMGS